MNKFFLKMAHLWLYFFIAGCGWQVRVVSPVGIAPFTPVFIAMPRNEGAIESLSNTLYVALLKCYQSRGYRVMGRPKDGYILRTVIRSFSPIKHFVSRDVVLLHKLVKISLDCSLYNFRGVCVAKESFDCDTLISKPRDPLLTDTYMMYAMKDSLELYSSTIEQAFQKYFR